MTASEKHRTKGESHHSPEMLAAIYDLYIVRGISAAQVAKQLGLTSKNVAVGLAHRRGWKRAPEIGYRNSVQSNAAKRPKRPKITAPSVMRKSMPEAAPAETTTAPIPFIDRRMGRECAYVFGASPAWTCCGRPVVMGAEWCADHMKVVWSGEKANHGRLDRMARLGR